MQWWIQRGKRSSPSEKMWHSLPKFWTYERKKVHNFENVWMFFSQKSALKLPLYGCAFLISVLVLNFRILFTLRTFYSQLMTGPHDLCESCVYNQISDLRTSVILLHARFSMMKFLKFFGFNLKRINDYYAHWAKYLWWIITKFINIF